MSDMPWLIAIITDWSSVFVKPIGWIVNRLTPLIASWEIVVYLCHPCLNTPW